MTREEFEIILEAAFELGYEDAENIIQEMDDSHKNRAKERINYVSDEYKKMNIPMSNNKKKSIIAGQAFHQYWSDYKKSNDPNKRKMGMRMYNISKKYDKKADDDFYKYYK